MKRIFPESLRDPTRGRMFRKLFFTEASLAGKLDHPHIAQIYDAGIGEDSGYIVMEFVPGGTMERFCAPDALLPVEQTVEIIFKCARALSYAHMQGVTHRDIKPGNLLYAAAPTDVRIGDFGLALNVGAETTQITGVGSPAYMSPEQIREELVDHKTDVYSLGVVMYQMLSGKLPFSGSNKFSMIYQITQFDPPPPSSHRPEVPESLDRIVRRAMHKDVAARYHSGDELAEALVEALRSGLGVRGATASATPTSSPRCARCNSSSASPSPSCGKWCASACGSACPPGPISCARASRAISSACWWKAKRASPRTASCSACSARANASARWPTSPPSAASAARP